MTRAVIYLPRFYDAARQIAECLSADLIEYSPAAFREAFGKYSQIAAVMSAGIAVRGISPLLSDKWTDPAVVVVTPDLGLAIPLIGGHHGGNALARELAPLGTTPVITTATERAGVPSAEGIAAAGGYDLVNHESSTPVNAAFLDGSAGVYSVSGPALVIGGPDVAFLVADGEYGVGIGCRKGVSASAVEEAVRAGLETAGVKPEGVLVYATTVRKSHEQGIYDAVHALGRPLIFLDDRTINRHPGISPSGASRLGLAGVAEPCALAVSKRKELVLPKLLRGGVTVAIAR
ncbi:MAG: cobalt-precorrin 5A hydrolase [Methanoregulaceae archaeon]|nr:cobalt-precorrin 5A hydrolase [Methanoregulaceae archaeon]